MNRKFHLFFCIKIDQTNLSFYFFFVLKNSFQSHVTFQDVVMNIETVLIYFANRIEGKEGSLSVDDVYSEIEHVSLQWPADKLKVNHLINQ